MDRAKLNGSVFSLICDNGETGIQWSLGSERHSLCKTFGIEGSPNDMLTYTQWEQGKITSFHKFWELNSFWKFFVCLSFLKSIGILQAEILERIAMPSSMGSPQPRDQTQVSCIADRFFTIWASRKVHIYTHTHIYIRIYMYTYT